MSASRSRRALAELLGTALLLATVVGSGIMAERLAGGNTALALLANALATGAGLVAFILALGPVSGAHFNPIVTLVAALRGELEWRDVLPYVGAQIVGALSGVALAHAMFELPLVQSSAHVRASHGELVAELVATFGLLLVIHGCARGQRQATPFAVAAYITAAYWFTSSTSFANPAVTLARSFTDTFSGIRAADVPGFVAAQLAGGALAFAGLRALVPVSRASAPEVASARAPQRHLEEVR